MTCEGLSIPLLSSRRRGPGLMDEPFETRTLSDSVRVLRARYRIILLTTFVAAGAGLALSLAQDRTYEATSTIALTPQFFVETGDQAAQAATAEIGLVTSDELFDRSSRALGGSPTPDQLRENIVTSFQPGTNFVAIKASSSSAEEAARIANKFARAAKIVGRNVTRATYLKQAKIHDDPTLKKSARTVDPVEIVHNAGVPASPESPKPLRDAFLAACLGLIIGLGLAFLRQSLDRRVANADDARRALDLPLLGYVRTETLGRVGMFANGISEESGEDLDAFRILRANVDFLGGDDALTTFAVTSPLPEEGKSTVSAGLAYANALAGRRTLLVECDFRRPMAAERLGFQAGPGLSDHLIGNATPGDVLRSIDVEGPAAEPLAIIPAGLEVLQPAELIASPQFDRVLAEVSEAYEVVVLDCAPILPVGDALELLPRVDGVLVCVRLGQTTFEQARAARDALGHLPARPTGLVITGLGRGSDHDYQGYYAARTQSEAAE